jgi:hypothetical protein
MKNILSKSIYLLFAIIAPILFLLIGVSLGGIVGVRYFLFVMGTFELFVWFIFLIDYDYLFKIRGRK